MPELVHGRFTCEGCGKSYRWKSELAGRKVKCKCGAVMICPQDEPSADEPQDMYDLAPDVDQPARRPMPIASPAKESSVAAPLAARVAAARAVPPVAAPLNYRKPRDETSAVDQYFPDRVKDLYAPLWLIGGSTVVSIVATAIALRGRPESIQWALVGVAAQMMIGTIIMLLGILAAAKMRGISFGPFWTAVLKLAAISVAPEAITTLTGLFFRVIPIFGGLINWLIGFCLYFALIGALFDLDQSDTWYCMCVIFLVKLAIFFAIFFGVLGMIMH